MSKKRIVHCDLQGTLLGPYGDILLSFLKAAKAEGHEVRTVSMASDAFDNKVRDKFNEAAEFLLPTLDKGTLEDEAYDNKTIVHDILIDDDPTFDTECELFHEMFATYWVDPNSQSLIDDLKDIAQNQLGFDWQP